MDRRRTGELAPLPPDSRVQDEQLHDGFTPLQCPACRSEVLVRKSGPAQTTIQWTQSVQCPERGGTYARPSMRSCPPLMDAIARGVADGRIIEGDTAWDAVPR